MTLRVQGLEVEHWAHEYIFTSFIIRHLCFLWFLQTHTPELLYEKPVLQTIKPGDGLHARGIVHPHIGRGLEAWLQTNCVFSFLDCFQLQSASPAQEEGQCHAHVQCCGFLRQFVWFQRAVCLSHLPQNSAGVNRELNLPPGTNKVLSYLVLFGIPKFSLEQLKSCQVAM